MSHGFEHALVDEVLHRVGEVFQKQVGLTGLCYQVMPDIRIGMPRFGLDPGVAVGAPVFAVVVELVEGLVETAEIAACAHHPFERGRS